MMRRLSLTATLAIAFGCTTLAVFIAVGGFVYEALEQRIAAQDDLDIVLAARHARRLTDELNTLSGIEEHEERLESIVLGNQALYMKVADAQGHVLLTHNVRKEDTAPPPATGPGLAPATIMQATARITTGSIAQWTDADGEPVRGIVTLATLRDNSTAMLLIARRMTDRVALLDRYRDTLKAAGVAGVLFSAALGYVLIWLSLKPLRAISERSKNVTVAKLDARLALEHVPVEFVSLVNALNAMLARLETGFQHMQRFTADLAHDMRTPVSNMRGAMEVALARPRSTEDYEQLLASNVEECDRLSRMIENVLFLARAEHPQFVRHMQAFDVGDELARMSEYFEGLADEAGIAIRATGGGRLTADVELFRRAVGNLLANAIRHTPRNGSVELSSRETPDGLQVSVFNQGALVPDAELERIFDRFYRGDPSRNLASGSTGLGLAIVRAIMELHGGSARAVRDEQGMRFVLLFPVRSLL
ncbi:heavy metal sensor histidine kinase [Paraburkholderia phosphatilytica]|uniref:heavy metal sensor histidine kinase n=1 Tax=Paraburkholderia phosphatilytica TaxID=2282883 RepID=UPI00198178D7|nr:heavy metal sensor histidine kinase [Paraburkholderia phosphatilytica]